MGYAYSTPEIAQYIQCLYKPFHINRLALEAAIAALSDVDFLEKTIGLIQRERSRIYKTLNRLKIKYWKSQGNFILLQPNMNDKIFEAKMLEQGIMVRPATSFGTPDCVRVTIGTEEANDAFMEGMERVLDEIV